MIQTQAPEIRTQGKLIAIQLRPSRGAPIVFPEQVQLLPGKGIEGDRQSQRIEPRPKDQQRRQVSLIEIEEIQAFNAYCQENHAQSFTAEMSRRNLVTEGIRLNELVGSYFKVGSAVLLGIELCQPCGYLEEKLNLPFRKGMTNKSGIRAEIIEAAHIQIGDEILFDPELLV